MPLISLLEAAVAVVPAVFAVAGRPLVHDGVGRIVGRGPVLVVVAGPGFAAPAPAAAAIAAVGRAVVTGVGVVGVLGVLAVGVVVAVRLAVLLAPVLRLVVVGVARPVGSALLAAASPASATAAAAPPAGRPVGLLVVVAVRVVGVGGLVGIAVVAAAFQRLRRDEQRHVMRPLGSVGGFQQQPGFGFAGDPGVRSAARCVLGSRLRFCRRLGGEQVTHPDRVLAVHRGVRAAHAAVQLAERVQHPLAGGSQRSGQRMNSQTVGQVPGPGRFF